MESYLDIAKRIVKDRKATFDPKAQDASRPVAGAPHAPILPGWLVVYRDRTGRLRGGFDEREHGTVAKADYGPQGWRFLLTDGTSVPMQAITAVAHTDAQGHIVAGWTVRDWGLNGEGVTR